MSEHTISTILVEERRYPPPPDFAALAVAQPDIYERDFDEFWESEGRERVTRVEPFTALYEWELPYAKWYLGGKLNVAYNCVDRHVEAGLGDRVAYHWEGEPEGEADDHRCRPPGGRRPLRERAQAARRRQGHEGRDLPGDGPGACRRDARLHAPHAPHTVVFGGFSADSLSDRANDMGCTVLVTQDEAWRRGTTVPLKRTADEAMADAPGIERCLVVRRTGNDVTMTEGPRRLAPRPRCPGRPRDLSARADGRGGSALPHVHVRHDREAEGDLHTTAGYLVGVAFDARAHLRPQAGGGRVVVRADIGWITGHSYIVYGPLTNGTTSVLYEGTPDFPDKNRWWEIVERYGVTTPTRRRPRSART